MIIKDIEEIIFHNTSIRFQISTSLVCRGKVPVARALSQLPKVIYE